MTFSQLQLLAGSLSSLIFVSSNFPMLWKVLKTRDVKSYSLGQIILRNLGNLVYWIYVASLPVGPVWYLQGFFTFSGLILLACYLKFDVKKWPKVIRWKLVSGNQRLSEANKICIGTLYRFNREQPLESEHQRAAT